MSQRSRPKTTSQALRTLGRIRAIEDPIRSGLIGFHKAENLNDNKKEKDEMKRQLNTFKSFCFTLERVVEFEQSNDKASLEKWLIEKSGEEPASRIEAYIAIREFLKDSDARNAQVRIFKDLCSVADKVLKGNVISSEIHSSVSKLEEVRRKIDEVLGPEKKTSEKILSGSALFT